MLTKKNLLIGGATILSLAVVLVSMYGLNFGCNADQILSSEWVCFSQKQDVWGQFGDFIGGILNPIFASVTLVIVAITSLNQMDFINKQTKFLNHDLKSKEIMHAVSNVKKELSKRIYHNGHENKISSLLSVISSSVLMEDNMERAKALAIEINQKSSMFNISLLLLENTLSGGDRISGNIRLSMLVSIFDSEPEFQGLIIYLKMLPSISEELLPRMDGLMNICMLFVAIAPSDAHPKLNAYLKS
jgi:hypothetical protein